VPTLTPPPACRRVPASRRRDPATRRTTEVELGRGSADFPELLGLLSEFNFRGWITIERRESPTPIPDIENAVAFLRAL